MSSNSRSGDLEKLTTMLATQGHAASLTRAGDVQTLTVTIVTSSVTPELPEPETLDDELANDQNIVAEYEAAERQWLDQDTAAEYEAVERRWLGDLGEWAAPALPWLQN